MPLGPKTHIPDSISATAVRVDITSDLPNGPYAEPGDAGSWCVHVPQGTNYSKVMELLVDALEKEGIAGPAKASMAGVAATTEVEQKVAIDSLTYKGEKVDAAASAQSGKHVAEVRRSMEMKTTVNWCCCIRYSY